jgi:hypothetical protein
VSEQQEPILAQSSKVNVNWFNFNVPTILAVLGVGWAVASYVKDMETRLTIIEQYRVSRSAITDRNFDEIQKQLEPVPNLTYRVNIVEQQIASVNLRLDRFTETLSSWLDAIRKDVVAVGTKVEVLSTRIEQRMSSPDRRTEADPPMSVPISPPL